MKYLFVTIIAWSLLFLSGCGAGTQQTADSLPDHVYEEIPIEPEEEPHNEVEEPAVEPVVETLSVIEGDHICFKQEYFVDDIPPYDFPICINLAAQFFAELCALFTQDGGYLWGRHLHTPFIFLCTDTRAIVANQQDSLGILTPMGYVYVGTLPEDFPAIYSIPNIGDRQWAMVPWDFLPHEDDENNSRMRYMAHLSFHVQQTPLFGSSSGWDNSHVNQERFRISIQLEVNALLQALQSEGEARFNAAHDALVIRAERRQGMSFSRRTSETALEFHEGITNYTDAILSGVSMEQIIYAVSTVAGNMRYQQSMAGIFGYVTGELYGHLLDYTGANWRESVHRNSDLGDMLQEALGIDELRLISEVDLSLYGYYEIVDFETERTVTHAQMLEDIRVAFTTETTLIISPGFDSGNIMLNPSRIQDVPGMGQAFGADVTVPGTFGDLRLYDGFYLRQFDPMTGMLSGAVIATGIQKDGNIITAPGWVLELNDGYGVRYEDGHYVLYRD